MKKTKYVVTVIAAAALFTALFSGCGQEEPAAVMEESPNPEKAENTEVKLVAGTEYSVSEMLYYSPDESDSMILDPGRSYKIGSDGAIDIVDAMSGEILESYSGDSYTEIDEDEWESLFSGGLTVDISSYGEKFQYNVSDVYRLYLMDDEVWFGTVKDSSLLSLFKMAEITVG